MKILVTGAAGFIGSFTAKKLLDLGNTVVGVDNLNDYYDVSLKQARLANLKPYSNFTFLKLDLSDRSATESLFRKEAFDKIIHLAAQAGVRYSIDHPHAYVESNLVGFINVLEGARYQWCNKDNSKNVAGHFIYASSSSVYGLNKHMPFNTKQAVDHPISLYAATKKSNELMAHAYSYLYNIPTTGLRFFTVYGPWGRPDMAYFKFVRSIINNEPIDIYNEGKMKRDFTYIDDVVDSLIKISEVSPSKITDWNRINPDSSNSSAPYRVYNIGGSNPVGLMEFVNAIEMALDKKAKINFLPMQSGDVEETWADNNDLANVIGDIKTTALKNGIAKFVEWYRGYKI